MRRIPSSTLFGVDPVRDNLHYYETSWLLSPTLLASLRALISTYIFVSIFFIWGWDGTHGDRDAIGQSFSFFTWLTYWGLGFYTLFAAIHTALYARTGRSVLFDRWPRTLRAMHGILYTTITVYPPLVTLVFWIILFKPPFYKETFTGWSNISQHGLNSLYAILEITLPTTAPHPWIYIPFLILFLLLYLCVAYITVHTEGFYAYSFLDIQANGSPLVTGYCFGILAAILVIFLVTWGLIWLRGWLVKGRIKRSTRDPLYGQDRCHGLEAGDQVGKVEPCEMKHVQV
ncbi:hypothetical protein N7533_006623 [Penicillium manginii]|uniref:uncharacterized protein n=1 Tax=Penicillium manginii TaxID=203109 RepID=UPI0025482BD5|nr:uncharacterized protein N7533_006623 [Penicillium manginii]KAJ5749595.1 hypothetical protein N7533_006623 [Penicillium manginii]